MNDIVSRTRWRSCFSNEKAIWSFSSSSSLKILSAWSTKVVSPHIPFSNQKHTCQNKNFLHIFISIVAVQLFLNRNNKVKLFSNRKIQCSSSQWKSKLKANSITQEVMRITWSTSQENAFSLHLRDTKETFFFQLSHQLHQPFINKK